MTKKNKHQQPEPELTDQTVDQAVEEQEQEQPELSVEEQLTAERDQYLEGWKRAQADYQNLKKTVAQEKQDLVKFANARLLEELIPIFDNYRMAVTHVPADLQGNSWVQGMEFILKQMMDILEEQGVEVIDPLGSPFNPHEQEAVEVSEGEGEETVTEVLQVGYKLNGRVIRSARVKVSS